MHVSYSFDLSPFTDRLPYLLLGFAGLVLAALRRDRLGRLAALLCFVGCGLLIFSTALAVPRQLYAQLSLDAVVRVLDWLRGTLGWLAVAAILAAVFVPRPRTQSEQNPPSA